jgi:hypothetical protein
MPHKLSHRSVACVFLGYASNHRGYRCMDLESRRIIISRHVIFDETQFPFAPNFSVTNLQHDIATTPAEEPIDVLPSVPVPMQTGPRLPAMAPRSAFLARCLGPLVLALYVARSHGLTWLACGLAWFARGLPWAGLPGRVAHAQQLLVSRALR